MWEERFVSNQGIRIWTESNGPASGTPVVCISGAGAHAHFWSDSFCEAFIEKGFFLIRYDHRDVGLSDASTENYDLTCLADDVIAILDGYNLQSAHLIGHSMGGYIAQLAAAEYPERVLSVTVIASGPVGETPDLLKAYTFEERQMLQDTWRAMMQNRPTQDFEESYPGYLGVWKRLNGLYSVDAGLAKSYTQEIYTRSHFPPGVHQKHVKVMQKMAETLKERKGIFEKIHQPVLILHGAEDYLVPSVRGGEALAAVLPQASFYLIPKMGHMLFHPELEKILAEKIIAFVGQR